MCVCVCVCVCTRAHTLGGVTWGNGNCSSLAVQGLGLHTSTAGAQVRSLVGKLRSHVLSSTGKKTKTKTKVLERKNEGAPPSALE